MHENRVENQHDIKKMHTDHKQQNTLPSLNYVQNFHAIDYFASKSFSAAIY